MVKRVARRGVGELEAESAPEFGLPADGPQIDDHVWFADRSHGRSTEHLATVIGGAGDALQLRIRDNGEDRIIEACAPWGSDSVQGWWRT